MNTPQGVIDDAQRMIDTHADDSPHWGTQLGDEALRIAFENELQRTERQNEA